MALLLAVLLLNAIAALDEVPVMLIVPLFVNVVVLPAVEDDIITPTVADDD